MRYCIGFITFVLISCQVTKPDFLSQPKDIIPLSGSENSNLEVAVALFDMRNEKWYYYNDELLKNRYSPASTFKIPNSIIGLQTRAVKSIDEIWNWDSIVRQNENWNKDHSMSMAFKNSTVWYYQKLAKEIGNNRMKNYLKKFDYGNQQIGDSIHQFWLNGNLQISPLEQLSFLYKLKSKKLDLREEVYEQLKKIMFVETIGGANIYAKTGWGFDGKKDIGWYVGYVEKNNNTYLFSTLLLSDNFEKVDNFGLKRIEITKRAFQLAKIIP